MKELKNHPDKFIFWVCLILAAGLFIGSFFCPPVGSIDGSILKAAAELLGFAALGIVGKNLAEGKRVEFEHGQTKATIGDQEEEGNE